jgi:uncharacterized membrane protein
MKDRNEFWQSQPELLAKTIQTANQNAQLASSSAIIFWHYTATQIKPTKAEIKALETKNDTKTNLPLIIGALAAAMITVFTAWIMLTFYDGFKTVGFFFEALFSTLLIALLMTAVVLPVILLFIVPILYVSDANQMAKIANFDPAKNRTYILTNEAFFVYLPNKYDKSLNFGLKIPISDISAIKTNPTTVEIYTNKVAPYIFNMPAAEIQALKKELLKYASDILDANK